MGKATIPSSSAVGRANLLRLVPAAGFLVILPFPHTVALRLLLLVAAAVIALLCWRQLKPPPFPLKAPVAIWALVLLYSLTLAVDLPYSIHELKNELGYTLIALTAFYTLAQDESSLRWLCTSEMACFLGIALSGFTDVALHGTWGYWGFYGGVGTISNYLVTAAPVVVLAVYLWNPPRTGAMIAGAAVLIVAVGMLTEQRAFWPAVGTQLAVLCVWLWRSGTVKLRRGRAIGVAMLVIALTGAGLWTSDQLRIRERPQETMLKDQRPLVWGEITRQLLHHPFRGAGFGQRAMIKAYPNFVPPQDPSLWHAHNLVLNYGVYAGIPGALAVLFLFGALFARFWSISLTGDPPTRCVGLAGAAMVAGVFMRNMFNDFFIRDEALLFWALTGMLLGYAMRRLRPGQNTQGR